MRRELTYAGKPLSEFGVWVDNSKIYRKPMKRYTGYDIPARNGTLYQSDNKFDNVTMEFNCYIKKDFDTNFSNLVNYLNSFDTYQKLENSYNTDMFRLALFHEAIEVETGQFLKDGQFRLYFDCKPQEFYKSGETYQTIQRSSSTVTGNPVTVENPSGLTSLTGLTLDIQPVQSGEGDPSPTNIRPITGRSSAMVQRTGKNIIDFASHIIASQYGVDATVNDDGSITLSGTPTTNWRYITSQFDCDLSGTYEFSTVNTRSFNLYITLWDGDTSLGNFIIAPNDVRRTVNVEHATKIRLAYSGLATESATNFTIHPMIRLASETDDTYEPYTGQMVTIDLNGTIYGGTLDVSTGVLTVTHKCYTASQTSDFGRNTEKSYYVRSEIISDSLRNGNTNTAQSDKFKSWSGGNTNESGIVFLNGSGAGRFNTVAPYNSISEMLTGIGGSMQIYYQLATPTTVQLTPQQVSLLTGTNIISTDMENTEVTISEPFTLENPSYMKAKPVFKVKVPSKVSINGEQVIDVFGMIDWAETPSTAGDISYQVFDGYIHVEGQQSTDFERYIAYLTVPAGTYSVRLNGHDYRSLVQLKVDDGSSEVSAFINTDYTFTVTEKTTFTLSVFIQSNTQVNDDFTLTLDGQSEYIYINSELMDAYYEDGTNANPYVSLSEGFIELPSGETYITVEGEAEIMPNWWRL